MTKSRKRMLLSSIAMLLVALVALGSATFAWYFTNTTVTASTTTFKASTSDGLEISHTKATWGTSVTDLVGYDGAKVLTPASFNYGNFAADDTTSDNTMIGGTGKSSAYDLSTLNTAGLQDVAVTNGSYFLVDTFYVASSSNTAQTATFTITGQAIADSYLNVAVFVDNALVAVYTTDDATSTEKVTKTGTTMGHAAYEGDLIPFTGSAQTVTSSFSAAPKGSGNGGTAVHIVAFADGFNENCKSSTVNTEQLRVTYEFTAA